MHTRTARISLRIDELRSRLEEMQGKTDSEQPIQAVAIQALKQELCRLGHSLSERMRGKL